MQAKRNILQAFHPAAQSRIDENLQGRIHSTARDWPNEFGPTEVIDAGAPRRREAFNPPTRAGADLIHDQPSWISLNTRLLTVGFQLSG